MVTEPEVHPRDVPVERLHQAVNTRLAGDA
jgi:hypothetical protein